MLTWRVLIVDDHAIFREGLRSLLQKAGSEFDVVGEAADGAEAIRKATELVPDVILMDIGLPVCNGIEATRAIKLAIPSANVVILTVSEMDDDLFAALKAGAKGYILKTVAIDELTKSLSFIVAGQAVISPPMASKLLNQFNSLAGPTAQRVRAAGADLTDREREVLSLVAKGASNRQIAETLVISENTVKYHLRNILDKLHLHNRIEAAIYELSRRDPPFG